MNLLPANKESISRASEIIKTGGLVAFPTETVYGLGANGLNPAAIAKIFEVKKRPAFNPLILHISRKDWLGKYAVIQSEKVERLIAKFWPGPLTLVLSKTDLVPGIVTAGNPTVAIRMPANEIALRLIDECGLPIAAPSANRFGHLSPTEASHVAKYMGEKIDLILDGGKCTVGVESTILEFNNDRFYMLRPGGLSIEEIEAEIGKIEPGSLNTNKPNSPGQLLFHYSPKTPLKFFNPKLLDPAKKTGVIFFNKKLTDFPFSKVLILSVRGDLREAAGNLFSFLHEMEKEHLDVIFVESVEEKGLGIAIMDRLKRAVKKHV